MSGATENDTSIQTTRMRRLARLTRADPYLQVPEAIRAVYSRDEWLWLTDEQKAHLIDHECTPWHETP